MNSVSIEVINGPLCGNRLVFSEPNTFVFGRQGHAVFRIANDPEVSRHHFILEVAPPIISLRDLGSRNGTLVNEVRYGGRVPGQLHDDVAKQGHPAVHLKHGDIIRVGKTQIRVDIDAMATHQLGPVALRCSHCGQISTVDATSGHGEYVCVECRQLLMNDPARNVDPRHDALNAIRRRGPIHISGYELLEKIGQGGMGVVFKALRQQDGAQVAIKLMLPQRAIDERGLKIFEREISVTQQLSHPHVVRLIEHGMKDATLYFVLDFCNGGSLERWQHKYKEKMPWSIAGPLMIQALNGLLHAHDQGIVHRDLKPQNLLMHRSGKGWSIRIADFGLAKSFERAGLSGMTATGMAAGSPGYMPREQLTNYRHLDPASDVWSIAATFYSLLTGCVPRDFTPGVDPIRVVLQHPPVPIRERDSTIPAELAAVFDRALEDDLAKRYRTVVELLRDVRPWLAS